MKHKPKETRLKPTKCRHFTGVQNEKCKAGVCYSMLCQEGRLPCIVWSDEDNSKNAKCAHYAQYTAEELLEQQREQDRISGACTKIAKEIMPLRSQVKKTGKGASVVLDCPACRGKKTIQASVNSYNGHARVYCSSCKVGWVE